MPVAMPRINVLNSTHCVFGDNNEFSMRYASFIQRSETAVGAAYMFLREYVFRLPMRNDRTVQKRHGRNNPQPFADHDGPP